MMPREGENDEDGKPFTNIEKMVEEVRQNPINLGIIEAKSKKNFLDVFPTKLVKSLRHIQLDKHARRMGVFRE